MPDNPTATAKERAGAVAPDNSKALLEEVMSLHQTLKEGRSTWDSHWQGLANYTQPRKANITEKSDTPDTMRESRLFDTTAIQANMVLAAGHMTWLTPMENLWFSYDAPPALAKDDEARGWFHRCTIIAAQELARSNFYTEVHEAYLDRGGFGTCSMFMGEGTTGRSPIHFRHEDIGTYSIAEDHEGYADTHIRDFELTPRQAVQKFGRDALHDDLLKAADDPKRRERKYPFIQALYPRLERDETKIDTKNKAFASIYIDTTHRHLVEVGGYDELPQAVSRFMKWGREPYGWSPAWIALPDARQLNFLEKNLDLLSELMLFPRFLVPASLKGRLDLRPGGATYLKDGTSPENFPKEWATSGEIKQGMERAAMKRINIDRAFHVDLFQMFRNIERQMTATEVAERAAEKLIQFSPTFSRLTTEFYGPILRRLFRMLYNAGKFPPAPAVLFKRLGGVYLIAEPELTYNSRVALAMKQVENVGFLRTLGALQPIFPIKPDLLDHYNWNAIVRDMARNDTTPEEWILPGEQVAAIQQQRAQQQAQLEHAQIAEQAAGAVAKLGSVKPGSPGDKIVQMQQEQAPVAA